jgi:predicted phosphodiesterase
MGYDLNIFLPSIFDSVPESDIIIFGHTHRPVNLWYDEKQLLFNPGSCCMVQGQNKYPTIGVLYLRKGCRPEGVLVELLGEKLKNRHWIKE